MKSTAMRTNQDVLSSDSKFTANFKAKPDYEFCKQFSPHQIRLFISIPTNLNNNNTDIGRFEVKILLYSKEIDHELY